MKIRPIKPQPDMPAEFLNQRLKECTELVRAYHAARVKRDMHAAHAARLGISLFVSSGVYTLGGEDSDEHFAVYGPILSAGRKLVSPERLFVVPVIPIREVRRHIEILEKGSINKWTVPLVDTEGFLAPVVKDGYYGVRFKRVGDIVQH